MTKDVNQVVIVGNLVSDPVFKEANGKITAIIRVATGKLSTNSNAEDELENYDSLNFKETVLHDIRVHVDHIVSLVREVRKGDRVVIGGELRNYRDRSYIILLAPQARFYKVAK